MLASRFLVEGQHTQSQLQTQSMAGNAILPIRFFKIILKTNLESLKIPNMFTRRYGSGLSNPVFLKPPDGTEWEVYWTKKNGEFWFQKGWKEFAKTYSLDLGNLVVFTYQGTSQIHVFIVDQSNIQIDQSDDESVEIVDELKDHTTRPHKKIKGNKSTQRSLSLNWPREPRTQEIATKFISESDNPFFTKYMKPIHLAENHMSVLDLDGYIENKKMDVKLQLGKRLWDVKLLGSHNSSCRRFSAGWSLFASENELQPGDICIFELINKQDIVFQVHVFKSTNN